MCILFSLLSCRLSVNRGLWLQLDSDGSKKPDGPVEYDSDNEEDEIYGNSMPI